MKKPVSETWTFGVEHELADWFFSSPMPLGLTRGMTRNTKDYTIVNSSGIANDPSGRLHRFGGELNTDPTDTASGQCEILENFLHVYPQASVNYRSNLHIHIRIPGLRDDLRLLKRIQSFNRASYPVITGWIDPVPMIKEPSALALARYRRRKKSHHHQLSPDVYHRQMIAQTPDAFFAAEVPAKDGRPLWHLGTRCGINMRQLLETDTIEFRHFAGTRSSHELLTAIEWCRDYLLVAISGDIPARTLFHSQYKERKFPRTELLDFKLEQGYRMTCHDGTLTRKQIIHNIGMIRRGYLDQFA